MSKVSPKVGYDNGDQLVFSIALSHAFEVGEVCHGCLKI